MDKKTLKECIERLNKIKSENEESLRNLDATEKSLEENSQVGDDVDQSTTLSELIRVKNIKRQLAVKTIQIQSAEKRIANNNFGVCLTCEDDIPKNRLLANPLSIRCLSCQEDAEQIEKENKQRNKHRSVDSDSGSNYSDDE